MTLVPFGSGNLKALAKAFASIPDNEFESGMKPSFAVLRIKGKIWAITKGSDREVIQDAEELPARTVDVIVLRATPGMSKTFYEKKFDDGAPAEAPDCYSNHGDKPAPDARSPQATSCAACPHNVWGSRISDNGKKGKACGDSKRLAVASPSNLEEPMLLSVPPDSLKGWDELVKYLKQHGLTPPTVVVRLGFDQDSAHPKITWKPMGVVPADRIADIQAAREADTTLAIVGAVRHAEELGGEPVAEPEPEPAKPAPKAEPAKPAAKPAPKAKPAAKAEAAADPILSDLDGLDDMLDGIDFGSPE
jgi:hypothetical protein